MKINWGTGLVIGMVAFISFIMYFVVTMISSKEFDHDLVVEDYYKAELQYQQDIDAERNALGMDEKITLENKNSGILIHFPEELDLEALEGQVNFYRPSNKLLDFSIPFSEIESKTFAVPSEKLVGGRWNVSVNWKQEGKEFLFKKEINH
ncbi:FixH family protein [Gramella sp. MT6]|uniref:FixH family protein n=1 Tax=Gramella sp. MT6 TaxID=2705471 RepID=UPI001C5E80E1|nr:FixH family protein [Gramella sp. MT6]QYA25256.1 FixH family protein [Gramella sp. MT6]